MQRWFAKKSAQNRAGLTGPSLADSVLAPEIWWNVVSFLEPSELRLIAQINITLNHVVKKRVRELANDPQRILYVTGRWKTFRSIKLNAEFQPSYPADKQLMKYTFDCFYQRDNNSLDSTWHSYHNKQTTKYVSSNTTINKYLFFYLHTTFVAPIYKVVFLGEPSDLITANYVAHHQTAPISSCKRAELWPLSGRFFIRDEKQKSYLKSERLDWNDIAELDRPRQKK